jgi:polyhydroxyalkanoate synthesis regulator phasin
MAPDLAGSQISALLETVPGIASVLRSPVADALINMIRAGAGIGEYRLEDAQELVQFAVRRGLIGAAEGDRVLQEVRSAPKKARASKSASKRTRRRPVARKRSSKKRR